MGNQLCRKHYMRQRRKGSTADTRKNARKPCSEDGCERSAAAHGKCEKHYRPAHRRAQSAERKAALVEERRAEAKPCADCGKPIPAELTRRAKFCSTACKVRSGNGRLSTVAYAALLADQGGRCAICGTTDPGKRERFNVDHCHTTGYLRGLLCHGCNTGLGLLGDSVDTLLAAVAYLRRHREEAVDLEGHEAEGCQAAG